ncbi:MAG: glycosyltransferase family 2 protein [Phycisphaerae bacterium]
MPHVDERRSSAAKRVTLPKAKSGRARASRESAGSGSDLSIVIPVYNEEASLDQLHQALRTVLERVESSYEILFVDDGSSDGSAARVRALAERDPHVRLIPLRGNFGKSAALAAGFDQCRGQIVITMDADLQDDPEEIPRFLTMIEAGYDLVSGYKKTRHDPWHKVAPSRVYNWIVRRATGIELHDVNCGFKGYHRDVIEEIRVYGSLHRLIPVLAHWRRFRIGELVVKHHPRRFGHSKFGIGRFYEGLVDLFSVTFLMRYERRPAHFFGKLGMLFGAMGFLCCAYLTVLWFQGHGPIGQRPLLILGILLIIVGVQFFATGLIAELLSRVTRWQERPYAVTRRQPRQTETDSKSQADSNDGRGGQDRHAPPE